MRRAWWAQAGRNQVVAHQIVGSRYRLQERIGRGGTATVWRGLDLTTGDPVAVKVLHDEQAARPVALERLRREAEAVAQLRHPNIVASHGLGIDGDGSFLAMELVEGRTVADLLTKEGPLPVDKALWIAEQVCAALTAAHSAGIIHRDIKPGNLIVSSAGVVKVCDFGIARLRARDANTALTGPSDAVGTCEYMAPEQANGDPIDARTDLYAVGCVLYAMLTGQPPLVGETAMAVMHQHLHRSPLPLRNLRSDIPAELDELVGRLLAKSPADRPGTATEVRARLTVIRSTAGAATATEGDDGVTVDTVGDLAGPTVVLPRTSGRHRTAATPGRPAVPGWLARWWVTVVAAALVLATAATVTVVVTGRDAHRSPTAGPVPAVDVPSPTQPEPAPETSTPATRTTTPPAATRPATPIDRLSTFAGAIQRQVDGGELTADAGRDLLRQLGEAAEALRDGKVGKAVKKLHEVDRRLTALRRDGKLTADGFAALNVIDPIIAAIR
jgi:serine/threonine-protein kinase